MANTIRDEIKQSYLNEGGLQENLTNQSQTAAKMTDEEFEGYVKRMHDKYYKK